MVRNMPTIDFVVKHRSIHAKSNKSRQKCLKMRFQDCQTKYPIKQSANIPKQQAEAELKPKITPMFDDDDSKLNPNDDDNLNDDSPSA